MRSSKGRAFIGVVLSLCVPVLALAADGGTPDAATARPAARADAAVAKKTASAAKQAPGAKGPAAKQSSAKQAAAAKAVARQAAPAKPVAKAPTAPKLPVEQIVQRHLAARGGAQAWKAVQTMEWSGKMEIGYADSAGRSSAFVKSALKTGKEPPAALPGKPAAKAQVQVPFLLELKRPEKSRVEIQFGGKTAVQVYDGQNGWLKRPYLNREDWAPFNAEQAKAEQGQFELGGPLVDAAGKGSKIALEAVEAVDGRAAYKLRVTGKGGEVRHVWVDAKTFLDVKLEGTPRRMDGKLHAVSVIARDFRQVEGLMVPFQTETAVEGYPDTHKMTVVKVTVNPRLDDARFTKPKA